MSNEIIFESSAMWMNVYLNPFFIWNSYSFQTELPLHWTLLGLENKQKPCHFLLNPKLHMFSFSVQVYFKVQQHGQNFDTFSPCLLHLLSCEVRPLWVRQVNYAVETKRNWCTSFNAEKLFVMPWQTPTFYYSMIY